MDSYPFGFGAAFGKVTMLAYLLSELADMYCLIVK